MFQELKRIAIAVERIADVMEEMRDEQRKMIGFSQSSVEKGEQIVQSLMGQLTGMLTGPKKE